MFVTVGKLHSKPSANEHDYSSLGDSSGVVFNKQQLQLHCKESFEKSLHCNAYACLYGKLHEEIQIAFTYNNRPFTIREGKTFHAPIPTGDKRINLIYHPTKHSPVDIEEFASNKLIDMSADLLEENIAGSIQFPKLQRLDKTFHRNNLIHFAQDSIVKLQRPIVAITVGVVNEEQTQAQSGYLLNGYFGIEAGYILKELVKGTTRFGDSVANSMVYYYLYNHEPSLQVYVALDSLNGGDADLYLGRG